MTTSTNDDIFAELLAQGYTSGGLNDKILAYLKDQTGVININDAEYVFYETNLNIPDPKGRVDKIDKDLTDKGYKGGVSDKKKPLWAQGGGYTPPVVAPEWITRAFTSTISSNTINVAMPTGVQTGDLLVAFVSIMVNSYASNVFARSVPSGWVAAAHSDYNTNRAARVFDVYYKIATESNTLSINSSTNGDHSAVVYRFAAGTYHVHTDSNTTALTSSTNLASQPLTVLNDKTKLYIAASAVDSVAGSAQDASSYPASLTNTGTSFTTVPNNGVIYVGELETSATSFNPGNFTIASARNFISRSAYIRSVGSSGSAPTFVSSAQTDRSFTNSFAVTMPSGIQSGDLIVTLFMNNAQTLSSTPSSGWYRVPTVRHFGTNEIFIRRATGSNSLTITSSDAQWCTALTYVLRGADIERMLFSNTVSNVSPTAHTINSFVAPTGDRNYTILVSSMTSRTDTTYTYPAGTTNTSQTTSNANMGTIAAGIISSTSATFPATTFTASLTSSYSAYALVFWGEES